MAFLPRMCAGREGGREGYTALAPLVDFHPSTLCEFTHTPRCALSESAAWQDKKKKAFPSVTPRMLTTLRTCYHRLRPPVDNEPLILSHVQQPYLSIYRSIDLSHQHAPQMIPSRTACACLSASLSPTWTRGGALAARPRASPSTSQLLVLQ